MPRGACPVTCEAYLSRVRGENHLLALNVCSTGAKEKWIGRTYSAEGH
jgi:hypothetical protein